MSTQAEELRNIDDALEKYFNNNRCFNYRDNNHVGRFMKYIIDEQLDDPELPIEDELGDDCEATDCSYSWMYSNGDNSFPVPNDVAIPDKHMEEYIFYVLQHCYKYHEPPTSEYIKANILCKVNGKVTDNTSATGNISKVSIKQQTMKPVMTSDASTTDEIPAAFSQIATYELKEEFNADTNDDTNEGKPNKKDTITVKRISKTEFKPKYAARAHLNIFTSKDVTKMLMDMIEEPFDNELHLYYFTDITTALQINDHQVNEFKVFINSQECKFGIINYDFHVKGTQQILYGIFIPNDECKVQQDKWLWKLNEFLTAQQISHKYGVTMSELPQSSRQITTFQQQLKHRLVIQEALIDETDWFSMKQIKSLKRNVKIPKVTVTLSKEMWMKECKKSFRDSNLPLIPVVVNKKDKHWVEWVKIIYVKSQNIYVGISCKYNEENNEWRIESICLDRGDIYNKHRLVGLIDSKYIEQLKHFKMSITEIIFSDNTANDIDKKMNVLKQQITSQQNSIVRLKESLLRAKNNNKVNNDNMDSNVPSDPSIQQQIQGLIDDDDDFMVEQDPLGQIVDDVIKKYAVLPFKTTPIGAKRNIYINKQFTKSWINYVSPRFNDESMMYCWLDYTTAIQMIQGYAKQYVDKENKSFIVAIINYELKDNHNNLLYGIVFADNNKNKKNDIYPYKLTTLMTKQQIHKEFGINDYDLPKKSRKHSEFISKLILRRKILKQDLKQIRWANLKLFKSPTTTNGDQQNKSVTITRNVMKEYINVDLERLNNNKNNDDNHKNLIPILVVDKYNSYYCIDWVLIVHIIHRHCDIGVSFRYNQLKNLFVATAIYLDKDEIESKHKLVGLKHNYCQNMRSFSLKKLKFKADKNTVHDDDNDDNKTYDDDRNNDSKHSTQILQFEQLIQNEQLKTQQLQQELINQRQIYIQQINTLRQQNQHYALTMQQQPQYNNNNTMMNPYYSQY